MKKLIFISLLLIASIPAFTQIPKKNYILKNINQSITIDGILDEKVWQETESVTGFYNNFPNDEGKASNQTEVKLLIKENVLYVSATCLLKGKAIIQNLKRDGGLYASEAFAIVLDPNNQQQGGYYFGVNAGGAQIDGLVEIEKLSTDWNAKWESAVKIDHEYWTLEMAIPIGVMRFAISQNKWGINFLRCDAKNNSYSSWNKVPTNWKYWNLGFQAELLFENVPTRSNKNNIILPYLAYTPSKDFINSKTKNDFDAGIEAKIAVGSRLNLDVTVNPDFSQIEVDNQIINLDRNSPLLPERRVFFLENAALFGDFGVGVNRPFISRSIGLAKDGRQIPIIGGLRLTGNLNDKLRIGLMDVQTQKFENTPSQNLLVGVFDKRVLTNSTFKGIITNKTSLEKNRDGQRDYNTLVGLEFIYRDKENSTKISLAPNYTFNTFGNKEAQFILLHIGKVKRTWNNYFYYTDLGTNFNPEMGFSPLNTYYDLDQDTIQRIGYRQVYNSFTKNFYLKSKLINFLSFTTDNFYNLFSNGEFWDAVNRNSGNANFKNTSVLSIGAKFAKTQLLYPTKFIGNRIEKAIYYTQEYRISYTSDFRKMINYSLTVENGDYFNGIRNSIGAKINYRVQPHFDMQISSDYTNIKLNNKEFEFLLFNSKLAYSFTTNLSLSGLFQYNTQSENFGVNMRLNWRYKPMSDFFIVYNDNYRTNNFAPTFRSISLKINYWFGL